MPNWPKALTRVQVTGFYIAKTKFYNTKPYQFILVLDKYYNPSSFSLYYDTFCSLFFYQYRCYI